MGAGALLLALAGAPLAGATPVTVASVSSVARAGEPAQLTLVLTPEARSCSLQFQRGRVIREVKARTATHERLRWAWRTPANARAGNWRLRATCDLSDGGVSVVKRTLAVRGPKTGRLLVAERVKVKRYGERLPSSGGAGTSPAENPYPKGECTYWAHEKRPDITENSWPAVSQGHTWDAQYWDNNARNGGYRVDGVPRVGDIAVWEANYAGVREQGHVAYVEAVHEDGSITVSETGESEGVRTRVVRAETVSGLSFIHRRADSPPPSRNPFPAGQCTYWAYEKRPDIYENSWASDGYGWSAKHWDDNARNGGYAVDGSPRVGDIAVWEAGYAAASSAQGHVAYVEAVHEDGSTTVSEMNWAGNRNVSTRVVSAETVAGLSFIHRR